MNSRRRKQISKRWYEFVATYPEVDLGMLKSWERLFANANWNALLDATETITRNSWSKCDKNPSAYAKSTFLLRDLYGILIRMDEKELNSQWSLKPLN